MELILPHAIRWTKGAAAQTTRINLGATATYYGLIADRPVAAGLVNSFWLTDTGSLSYSDGTTWYDVATGSTGVATASSYPKIWTYQTVTSTGEEIWVRSQALTHLGCAWTRTATSLTVQRKATVTINDYVVVNLGTTQFAGLVTAVTDTTFTLVTDSSATASGTAAEYAVVPYLTHNVLGTAKTGGILTTPEDTQVLSLSIRTGDRAATYESGTWTSSGYYYLSMPASNTSTTVLNGAGDNTGLARALVPMIALNAVYTNSMARVIGAFVNYDTGGTDFTKVRFEGLGSSPVVIRVSF